MVLTRPGVDDSYPTRVSVPELKATQILNIETSCEKCALVEKLLEPEYCIYGSMGSVCVRALPKLLPDLVAKLDQKRYV
jgi:hypothetical protein